MTQIFHDQTFSAGASQQGFNACASFLFRFQHPRAHWKLQLCLVFLSGANILFIAHRWHSIKREDKAGKKNTRDQDPFPGLPMLYPWDSTIGFKDRRTDFRCVTLFASIRSSARCHCCAFSQQLMAALAKNRDEPNDIQHGTHMAKPSDKHLKISNFGGGKPKKNLGICFREMMI